VKKIEVASGAGAEEELHCGAANQSVDAYANQRSPCARGEWEIANAAGGNGEGDIVFRLTTFPR